MKRRLAREQEWREIGLGAQILRDLGISSIKAFRLTKSATMWGCQGFGIVLSESSIITKHRERRGLHA